MSVNVEPAAKPSSASQRMQQGFVALAGVALFSMIGINGLNVVCRYFFSSPLTWADEAMSFLMALSIFLGAIAVTARGGHICVDLVLQALPAKVSQVVRAFGSLVSAALLLLVGAASFKVVNTLHSFDQRSDALEIPIWMVQISLSLFLVMSACVLVFQAVQQLRRRNEHKG